LAVQFFELNFALHTIDLILLQLAVKSVARLEALKSFDPGDVVPLLIKLLPCLTQVYGILQQKLRPVLKVALVDRLWSIFVVKDNVPGQRSETYSCQKYIQNFTQKSGAYKDVGTKFKIISVV
jgi:hypothetical protein